MYDMITNIIQDEDIIFQTTFKEAGYNTMGGCIESYSTRNGSSLESKSVKFLKKRTMKDGNTKVTNDSQISSYYVMQYYNNIGDPWTAEYMNTLGR